MTNFKRFFASITLVLVLSLGLGSSPAYACDQTDIALDSVIFNGSTYNIYITFCLGGGQALPCGICPLTPCTSCADGADGDTRDFAFGFFGNGGSPITVLSFGPAALVGDSTGCANYGFDVGPQGAPFNSQATVYYAWDQVACYTGPGTPRGLSCLVQASGCGYAHQQCWNMNFEVDILPDSMRLFGAEGQGLPTTGCYPSPDMAIDFTNLPVEWGVVAAAQEGSSVKLNWSTVREVNNDHFRVERKEGDGWKQVGRVGGGGNTFSTRRYEFFDRSPALGTNQYRIVQVDNNGSSRSSDVLTVEFDAPAGMVWAAVGPVPSRDVLNYAFTSDQVLNGNLEVISLTGARVMSRSVAIEAGNNSGTLNIDDLESGIYYLRIRSTMGTLQYKFIKM